jgi:uncharacterized protein (DUF58 family)
VIRRATPLAFALAALLGWTLFLGVLVDRAELFIAAVPLAIALLSFGRVGAAPRFELHQEISADRLAEGDRLLVTVTVAATDPLPAIEILVALPPLLQVEAGNNRVVLGIAAGGEASWSFQLLCPARGRFELGEFYLRLWDRSGLVMRETRRRITQPVSVYPYLAPLRLVPQPLRTQHSFGNYVAPRLGEGIEPGEVRPFAPGDRIRHVNWRASLRHGQLFVTQHHEERNADIVLLLDTLSETGAPPYSTLDMCVRAAAALANAYLAKKDRVGFVEFGGYLRWINPATGRRQREILVEALLPAATHFSYVVPQLDRLPPRVLPSQALVIAVTPLLDERFIKAMIDLAARGFDLIVLAVAPIEPTRRILSPSALDEMACRLWAMEWRETAEALRRRGLVILEWRADTPLQAALAPVTRARPRGATRR